MNKMDNYSRGGHILGSLYVGASERFQSGIYPISRTVKANVPDLGVVEMNVQVIGLMEGSYESVNRVYDTKGISPTLQTYTGGNRQPKIIDSNIAHVFRIRKLTPRECWRLMGFKDEDYAKAAEVNSKTQLYKQAGNSICRDVLMALFSQLNIEGVPLWNEERKE